MLQTALSKSPFRSIIGTRQTVRQAITSRLAWSLLAVFPLLVGGVAGGDEISPGCFACDGLPCAACLLLCMLSSIVLAAPLVRAQLGNLLSSHPATPPRRHASPACLAAGDCRWAGLPIYCKVKSGIVTNNP